VRSVFISRCLPGFVFKEALLHPGPAGSGAAGRSNYLRYDTLPFPLRFSVSPGGVASALVRRNGVLVSPRTATGLFHDDASDGRPGGVRRESLCGIGGIGPVLEVALPAGRPDRGRGFGTANL